MRDLKAGVVRRRGRHHRWRVRSKWLALLLLAAATVITWQFARQQPSSNRSHLLSGKPSPGLPRGQRDDAAWRARQSDSAPLASHASRLVYPYSVIPGGIVNPDELKHIMEYDPVVSRHFRGFDYRRAHLVQVSEKQAMYISYRIGDRVYWTRRKVSLHPGETLITDGRIVARTRCGNQVAQVPLDAGSPLEPSTEELEQPITLRDPVPIPPGMATPTSASLAPPDKLPPAIVPAAKGSKWWFIPPPVYVPSGSSGEPLAVTPEPGTVLLISSGLAAVYWRSRKVRRNK